VLHSTAARSCHSHAILSLLSQWGRLVCATARFWAAHTPSGCPHVFGLPTRPSGNSHASGQRHAPSEQTMPRAAHTLPVNPRTLGYFVCTHLGGTAAPAAQRLPRHGARSGLRHVCSVRLGTAHVGGAQLGVSPHTLAPSSRARFPFVPSTRARSALHPTIGHASPSLPLPRFGTDRRGM